MEEWTMNAVEFDAPTMTRGDLKPDLEVIIGDASDDADFSALDESMVTVSCVQGSLAVVLDQPTLIESLDGGARLRVVREWGDGETDVAGRIWVTISVAWPGTKPQHFPEDTPLLLNIRKAPGDG
jgi:hypothetical protein